jgi:hypothetical protein
VVEVKPGEEAVSINVGWMVEKFVKGTKQEAEKPAAAKKEGNKPAKKKAPSVKTKKAAPVVKKKAVKKKK